jgi:hydrogenase maturation protease
MKTIVIGLGNPILGDDGVGWRVVDEVKQKMISSSESFLKAGAVAVDSLSLGGISLMEHLIGYQRVILIDAFFSEDKPGTIRVARLEEIQDCSGSHITSAHDTSLQNAMKLGRELGLDLPEDITVVSIHTTPVHDFREDLSPPVAQSVPKATQIVMDLLAQNIIIL